MWRFFGIGASVESDTAPPEQVTAAKVAAQLDDLEKSLCDKLFELCDLADAGGLVETSLALEAAIDNYLSERDDGAFPEVEFVSTRGVFAVFVDFKSVGGYRQELSGADQLKWRICESVLARPTFHEIQASTGSA